MLDTCYVTVTSVLHLMTVWLLTTPDTVETQSKKDTPIRSHYSTQPKKNATHLD